MATAKNLPLYLVGSKRKAATPEPVVAMATATCARPSPITITTGPMTTGGRKRSIQPVPNLPMASATST